MQTFFRSYDATLGRWTGIDPQTESAESLTVYNYSGNNPIMFNDPMGNSYAAPGHSREQFAKDFPFGEYEANSFDESSGGAAGFSSNQNWYDSYMNGLSGTDPWAAWNIGTSIGVRPTMGDIAPGTGMNYLIGTDGKTVQQSNGGDENTYQETIVDNTLHSNEPGYSWTQLQESNHNISELSYLLITNQINANQGGDNGITRDQYLFNFGLTAATVENFSGVSRLGNGLKIYTATTTGRVFMGNQYVKTLGIAKTAKVLGFVGAGIGIGVGIYKVANHQESLGKFGADGFMTGVGFTGFGTLPALTYFAIDAYYPGGFPAAMEQAAPLYNQMNQQVPHHLRYYGACLKYKLEL